MKFSDLIEIKYKKRIYVVGVRGMVSKELHQIKDLYIDFGKFYRGKRTYIKSENPLSRAA